MGVNIMEYTEPTVSILEIVGVTKQMLQTIPYGQEDKYSLGIVVLAAKLCFPESEQDAAIDLLMEAIQGLC